MENIPPTELIAIIAAITTAINSVIALLFRLIEKKNLIKKLRHEKETAVINAINRERGISF